MGFRAEAGALASRAAFSLVLGVTLFGCGSTNPSQHVVPSPSVVPLPKGLYLGIEWLADDWVVVSRQAAVDGGTDISLWRFHADGLDLQRVTAKPSDCRVGDAYSPRAVSDQTVVYWAGCRTDPSNDRIVQVSTNGQQQVLASLAGNPDSIAWDSSSSSGYVSEGSGVCDGIARVTASGLAPLSLEVGEGDQRFRVDEYFFGSRECRLQGRATMIDRTPQGSLAFFASPASSGGGSGDRLDIPWDLFLIQEPVDANRSQRIPVSVRHPRGLRWSPDGTRLAFSGEISGKDGSWIVDVEAGKATQFADVSLDWLAWSPAGDRIIGTKLSPGDQLQADILMFQVR